MMDLYLLQEYFKKDDPVQGMILLIAIAVLIVVFVVAGIIRNSGRTGGGVVKSGTVVSGKFSPFALHRAAKPYGLNHDQIKLLEYVLRSNGVTDVDHALNTPTVLDKHFKRTYKQIERSASTEEEAQQKIAMLFSVRNIIDVVQNTTVQSGSQQITANMAAVLTVNQETYPVKVISTKGESVLVECPRNAVGTLVRFPRGTRGTLAFFTRTNKGFSFDSQVLGVSDTSFGPALQLSRSARTNAMTQRRFRRRQAALSCGFYLVRLEEQKGKKAPRMIVDSRRHTGTLNDISIGGCAIKTGSSLPAGSRLKIEFDYTQNALPVAVLGQILRINRGGITSTILHCRFLKVPRKSMNAINSLVFEYGE